MWPDLTKFFHFGNIGKDFVQFVKAYFSIWQIFEPIYAAIGQILVLIIGK